MTMSRDLSFGRWRTVDIVLAAVLAVAFGAVFQAWNLLWVALLPAFVAVPPVQGFMYGVWLLPAVVVPLIIRRPGAALLGEAVAAVASALFGAPWGLLIIAYGLMQGGAAELVFAMTLYHRWGIGTALLAGAAAGAAAVLLDLALYYSNWATGFQALYAALVIPSAAIVAGLGGWLLVRALGRTGVLSAFPAGREQREV
ncbi:MAG: ECF transporter S component [Chloroflexota bacterium]|nr:ECF transporter S component [Chloroflexota bacterium]